MSVLHGMLIAIGAMFFVAGVLLLVQVILTTSKPTAPNRKILSRFISSTTSSLIEFVELECGHSVALQFVQLNSIPCNQCRDRGDKY